MEFELANQIARIFSRQRRHFHVAPSDWLNHIRELKSPATPDSNQLSVFTRTEQLLPDIETFETSSCTYFDFENISSPKFIRVWTLFIYLLLF